MGDEDRFVERTIRINQLSSEEANAAKAAILARIEENCLKQGGLPFSAMAKGSYVTNLGQFNSLHFLSFP